MTLASVIFMVGGGDRFWKAGRIIGFVSTRSILVMELPGREH